MRQIFSDIEINDYLTNLIQSEVDSATNQTLTALLTLDGVLFRRVVSLMIEGVVSISQLNELPDVSSSVILEFLDDENYTNGQNYNTVKNFFDSVGWKDFVTSRISPQDSVVERSKPASSFLFQIRIALDGAADSYRSYTDAAVEYQDQIANDPTLLQKLSELSELRTNFAGYNLPFVDGIFESFPERLKTVMFLRIPYYNHSTLELESNNFLGYIIRGLYRTELMFPNSLYSMREIIAQRAESDIMQDLTGCRTFSNFFLAPLSNLSKISQTSTNQVYRSLNQTFGYQFDEFLVFHTVSEFFFASDPGASSHIDPNAFRQEQEIYIRLIDLFDKIREILKLVVDLIETRLPKWKRI